MALDARSWIIRTCSIGPAGMNPLLVCVCVCVVCVLLVGRTSLLEDRVTIPEQWPSGERVEQQHGTSTALESADLLAKVGSPSDYFFGWSRDSCSG